MNIIILIILHYNPIQRIVRIKMRDKISITDGLRSALEPTVFRGLGQGKILQFFEFFVVTKQGIFEESLLVGVGLVVAWLVGLW